MMKQANFALFLLAISLFSCSQQKKAAAATKQEEKALTVSVQEASLSTLEDYIDFSGTVKALDTVTVYPTVAGKVVKLFVDTGDKVSKNQVIAQVDPSKPGAEFALSSVRASADGTITQVVPSVGAYVTASSAIADISSADKLEITVQVSERFVPFISRGQSADVSFKAYPDETFKAKVTKISPVLNPTTRTMAVTLAIAETRGIIKAGMFAHVRLVTQKKEDVIVVPNSAILSSEGKSCVFIAENGSAYRTYVETGLSVDGMTELTRGVKEGEAVVVRGQNMLSDRQKVNAVKAD